MGADVSSRDSDFISDAVLALCAIEITAGLDAPNAQWEKRGMATLRIGVGIHAGDVVLDVVSTGGRRKYNVTGDAVNTVRGLKA